ncbi:hypothetical protein [Paludibaculum fermentans]|uniref:hypothetical protein n=1 Tax=Paludibaculum fermentans TaxID=1473598 RepID=UPI003EBD02F1
MKLLMVLGLIVLAALSLSAADLAGAWRGSMETQMGVSDVVITIQPGAALAGKVKAGEYEAAIEKGRVDGEKIAFEMNIEHGKIRYEGTVAGDEMKLNVTGIQGDKYLLVCKRQK